MITIYKYLYMEEECSIRGLLNLAKAYKPGRDWSLKKKKIKLKTRHIFLLDDLVINHGRR